MPKTDQPLIDYLAALEARHIQNLAFILELSPEPESSIVERVSDGIRWRYHSRVREAVRTSPERLRAKTDELLGRGEASSPPPPIPPTYVELVIGLAKKLDVFSAELDAEALEKRVIYTVIAECLQRMTPEQRVQFFETEIDASVLLGDGVVARGIAAPLRTLSVIGVASTSGVGLYAAAATALGMVTHAVGVSLPAGLTAGVSSTVGFALGPAGWMAAGGWLAWRMTGPDWRVLTQVVVYLITERYKPPGA